MPTAWRIVKKRYAGSAFDGDGARRYGGRWNSPGTSVVYASETRALCLLEVLAGIRSVKPMHSFVLIPVSFENSLVTNMALDSLSADWRQSPPHPSTQRIGDAWLAQKGSVALRVPSAIVPEEFNYLLNPIRRDFNRIEVGTPQDLMIDPRLLGG